MRVPAQVTMITVYSLWLVTSISCFLSFALHLMSSIQVPMRSTSSTQEVDIVLHDSVWTAWMINCQNTIELSIVRQHWTVPFSLTVMVITLEKWDKFDSNVSLKHSQFDRDDVAQTYCKLNCDKVTQTFRNSTVMMLLEHSQVDSDDVTWMFYKFNWEDFAQMFTV